MYKSIARGIGALALAGSLFTGAYAEKPVIRIQPRIVYDGVLHLENLILTNQDRDTILHIYLNESTGKLNIRRCEGCNSYKDLIAEAMDKSAESITRSPMADKMGELAKGLKRVARNIKRGRDINKSVYSVNEMIDIEKRNAGILGYSSNRDTTGLTNILSGLETISKGMPSNYTGKDENGDKASTKSEDESSKKKGGILDEFR